MHRARGRKPLASAFAKANAPSRRGWASHIDGAPLPNKSALPCCYDAFCAGVDHLAALTPGWGLCFWDGVPPDDAHVVVFGIDLEDV